MSDSSHSSWNERRPFPAKEVSDLTGGIRRMYEALGERFTDGYADFADLEEIRELRNTYDDLIRHAVHELRDMGYSDRQIGLSLGVQQPAITKFYRRGSPCPLCPRVEQRKRRRWQRAERKRERERAAAA
jgi:predicted XRE-type DNA-binding protein